MEYSDDYKESIRLLATMISDMQSQIRTAVSPLANFLSLYQEQMQEIALTVGKFAEDMNRQWSSQIAPIIKQIGEMNRLDKEFVLPQDLANSISKLPQRIKTVVPVNEDVSDLTVNINIQVMEQGDKFTWRDAIAVISALIALFSLINDISSGVDKSEADEVRQEFQTTIDQTANYFINNYYINFPDEQPISSEDQP